MFKKKKYIKILDIVDSELKKEDIKILIEKIEEKYLTKIRKEKMKTYKNE